MRFAASQLSCQSMSASPCVRCAKRSKHICSLSGPELREMTIQVEVMS